MDMIGMMRQARELQQKMSQVQNELGEKRINGTAGGGMVKVTVNGKNELLDVSIERRIINQDNQEMLQELVMVAVNEANVKAREAAQAEMKKLTGGISIPGLF